MHILVGTVPGTSREVEVERGATVADVAAKIGIGADVSRCDAIVNGGKVSSDYQLNEGDSVLIVKGTKDAHALSSGQSSAQSSREVPEQDSKVMQAAVKGMEKYRSTLRELAGR